MFLHAIPALEFRTVADQPPITADQARNLAVRYHAFHSASERRDDNGIAVWGECLLDSLAETGVELGSPELIRSCVRSARLRMYGREKFDRIFGEAA